MNLSKYFTTDEMTCRCGCGLNNVDTDMLKLLHKARVLANVPFNINSWCRCSKHNKAVGGSANSSHLRGCAVDIRASDSSSRFKILSALISVGFNRIGIYNWGIHCDTDKELPRNHIWIK